MSSDTTASSEHRPHSIVLGDRLCIKCMYNLRGQPVEKEAEYGLFLVRCPECGTPAAIQEYPLLGRWPSRIRLLLATGYVLVLLLMLAATTGAFAGLASVTPEDAQKRLTAEIAEAWSEYEFAEHEAGRDAMAANGLTPWVGNTTRDANGRIVSTGYWTMIGPTWWKDTGRDEVVWPMSVRIRRAINLNTRTVVANALVAFAFGVLWSVLLIAARRRVLVFLGIVPVAITALFIWMIGADQTATFGWLYASSAASNAMLWPGVLVAGVLWTIAATLGLVFGRPLARLVVRGLLPPTMRGTLAELWFTDNKPLPSGTRALRTLHPEANPPTATGADA